MPNLPPVAAVAVGVTVGVITVGITALGVLAGTRVLVPCRRFISIIFAIAASRLARSIKLLGRMLSSIVFILASFKVCPLRVPSMAISVLSFLAAAVAPSTSLAAMASSRTNISCFIVRRARSLAILRS